MYWSYIGIMEKKIETTIWLGFRLEAYVEVQFKVITTQL